MNENPELGVLIASIFEQKRYSHCRLCLCAIQSENYARMQDGVANACSDQSHFIPLEGLLTKLLGKEFTEEIPGLDAVCETCVDSALNSLKFIEKCQQGNETLHKVLDDLNLKIPPNVDMNTVLYIVCREDESESILKEKDKKFENNKVKKVTGSDYGSDYDILFDYESNVDDLNNDDDSYICEKCQLETPDRSQLIAHQTSLNMYKCSQCPTVRCTIQSIEDHIKMVHNSCTCKECGKVFKGQDKLLIHEKKHANKVNICPNCGKQYLTQDCYYKHVKLCSEGTLDPHPRRSQVKDYICKECGKGYSTPGGLKVHERFTHGDAEKYACHICPKTFTAPSYLKAHLVTHTGVKNFCCELCGGKFVTKEALLYHTRRHTGEKPYSCDQCNEKFVNSSSRADHIKHKHIGPTLSCDICSRKFVTKNLLRLHKAKHNDPSNKLYIGRYTIPPNVPGEQNMRVKVERDQESNSN